MAKSEIDKLREKHGIIPISKYREFSKNLPVLSTGIFDIDFATGIQDPIYGNGGLRARDTAEVFGENNCGKTAIINSMIATTQKRWPDNPVVCIFSEGQDFGRMEKEGVDVEKLIIIGQYHDDLEDRQLLANAHLNAMLDFAKDPNIPLCVIDSIAALEPEANQEKSVGEALAVAALAKEYNSFSRKFVAQTRRAALIQANHYRDKINIGFKPGSSGTSNEPETPGGRDKEYYAKLRLHVSKVPDWTEISTVKQAGNKSNIAEVMKMKIKFARHKYAPAGRIVHTYFDTGEMKFRNAMSVLDKATAFSYKDGEEWKSPINPPIYKSGSWYVINGEKIQGLKNACQVLEDDPELMATIQNQILPYHEDFFHDENQKWDADEALDR